MCCGDTEGEKSYSHARQQVKRMIQRKYNESLKNMQNRLLYICSSLCVWPFRITSLEADFCNAFVLIYLLPCPPLLAALCSRISISGQFLPESVLLLSAHCSLLFYSLFSYWCSRFFSLFIILLCYSIFSGLSYPTFV